MHSVIQGFKAFQDSPTSKSNMNLPIQFLREVWSYIKQTLGNPQKVKDDEDTDVEKVVRILKVAMRTVELHFS